MQEAQGQLVASDRRVDHDPSDNNYNFDSKKITYTVQVLDTSGSMSDPARVQTSPGKYEGIGQTVLQLVSSAASSAISVMNPNQYAGLVSFSSQGVVKCQLLPMTVINRKTFTDSLFTLRPEGSTNIWDAIFKASELLLPFWRKNQGVGKYSIDLLTDGCPNVPPSNLAGYAASLRDYRRSADGFMPTINTFAFSYASDVKTLLEIAMETGGHFYFVPTPDMVATNFVNASAMLGAQEAAPTLDTVSECWRLKIVPALREMHRHCGMKDFNAAAALNRSLSEGMRADIPAALSKCGSDPCALVGFLKDIEEQVAIAVSDASFFQVWGHAYLLSLARAHELMIPANYKDPGLQFYGGPKFRELQAIASTNFKKAMDEAISKIEQQALLSPPSPYSSSSFASPSYSQAAVQSLYNPAGGCIGPESPVLLANGWVKLAKDIRRGDIVKAAEGDQLEIIEIMITKLPPTSQVIRVKNGPDITGWHPIRDRDEKKQKENKKNNWCFPAHLDAECIEINGTAFTMRVEVAYSFAGKSTNAKPAHGIIVNGYDVATLGHLSNDNVLSHSFYGSREIVDQLADMRMEAELLGRSNFTLNDGEYRIEYSAEGKPLRIIRSNSRRSSFIH